MKARHSPHIRAIPEEKKLCDGMMERNTGLEDSITMCDAEESAGSYFLQYSRYMPDMRNCRCTECYLQVLFCA